MPSLQVIFGIVNLLLCLNDKITAIIKQLISAHGWDKSHSTISSCNILLQHPPATSSCNILLQYPSTNILLQYPPATSSYNILLQHPSTISSCNILLQYPPATSSYNILLQHPPTTSSCNILLQHPPATASVLLRSVKLLERRWAIMDDGFYRFVSVMDKHTYKHS